MSDLNAMVAWYESRLGFVVTGRGLLGLKAMMFETDDLEAITALLTEHQVDMVWADQPLSAERRSTLLRDPEGNLIHIFGPMLRHTGDRIRAGPPTTCRRPAADNLAKLSHDGAGMAHGLQAVAIESFKADSCHHQR
ncbi:VOC family protein [Paraburkholderia sp. UCT70]|uniref:VOC family protein n=1 Tax=Paraburkholderia sp. UCT70 TaxID=2991068 RepID=UPI003D1FEED1